MQAIGDYIAGLIGNLGVVQALIIFAVAGIVVYDIGLLLNRRKRKERAEVLEEEEVR